MTVIEGAQSRPVKVENLTAPEAAQVFISRALCDCDIGASRQRRAKKNCGLGVGAGEDQMKDDSLLAKLHAEGRLGKVMSVNNRIK